MSDKTSGMSLVPAGSSDLTVRGRKGNKLIRRAASDALVPIRAMMNQQATTLQRVGTREFHDEDYQQLQVWASELGMEGGVSEFVEAFDKSFLDRKNTHWAIFQYTEGNEQDWYSDGRIRFFAELGETKLSSPRLSKLTHLIWAPYAHAEAPLKKRNLSSVPALTYLWCRGNKLTELDLSSVPALTVLWCDGNQLTELDLSPVPALIDLVCADNQLTEINLSYVPALEYLICDKNLLTELDIRSCLYLTVVRVDPWVVVHKRPEQTVAHRKEV